MKLFSLFCFRVRTIVRPESDPAGNISDGVFEMTLWKSILVTFFKAVTQSLG